MRALAAPVRAHLGSHVRPRLALPVLALLLAIAGSPAAADEIKPELQRMRFIERGQNLTATGNLTKLFDQTAYEALSSGFPSTILIGTAVYPRGGANPAAVGTELRTVVYDPWDEQYVIRIEGSAGKRTRKVKYRAEALKILTALDDFPVAPLAAIPYKDIFYLTLSVQLNPVSKETLAEVRRWLSRDGGSGFQGGGDLIGSLVSAFANPRIADADRVLRIRSQPFFRPKP